MIFSRFGKKSLKEDSEVLELLISKKNYHDIEEWAKEEGISVEDVISKGIAMYEIARHYRKQGLELAAINDALEVQLGLKIPGITTLESDPFASKSPEEVR